jgi:TatD DNase family protein
MLFIDSHCHLDIMDKAPGGLAGVLERMRQANTRCVTIGTQKDDWPIIAEIAAKNPDCVRYTAGLHPQEVKENWREHIEALEKILAEIPTPFPLPSGGGNIYGDSAPTAPRPGGDASMVSPGFQPRAKLSADSLVPEGQPYVSHRFQSVATGPCPHSISFPLAIGEIGLDYYRLAQDPHPADTVKWQRATLEAQLSILKNLPLPCCIHARGQNAFAESLSMIDRAGLDWRKVVYHCFSEGPAEIRELNARGGRASFTGIITFKNGQKTREALLSQKPELLMVETDAPFLSPEPHRGQVNEPSRVGIIAAKSAELLKMPLEELASILEKNTREFYGITEW